MVAVKPNLKNMLKLLKDDADLDSLVAELRDSFLDIEAISEENGYDILPEVVSDPEHVIFYAAMYIDMLKRETKQKANA